MGEQLVGTDHGRIEPLRRETPIDYFRRRFPGLAATGAEFGSLFDGRDTHSDADSDGLDCSAGEWDGGRLANRCARRPSSRPPRCPRTYMTVDRPSCRRA